MRWRRLAVTAIIAVTSCQGALAGSARQDAGPVSAQAPAPPIDAAAMVPNQRASTETPRSWHGSYKSQSGTLYVPADWKGVHWNVAESSAGIGDGTIRLILEPAGRIHGTMEGPLGPAVVAGFAADGGLTAIVRPENPADRGFGGTLMASVVDGRLEGTIRVSPATADAVRVATFVLGADEAPGR
jgi:hypothetical protein